jgi:hypothetical protein
LKERDRVKDRKKVQEGSEDTGKRMYRNEGRIKGHKSEGNTAM